MGRSGDRRHPRQRHDPHRQARQDRARRVQGQEVAERRGPLPDDAPAAAPVDEETVARLADLRDEWKDAEPERKAAIEAEVKPWQGDGS